MPERDLVGMSRQVIYEFEMVEAIAKRLTDINMGAPQDLWRERFGTRPPDLQRAWWETNALLESLLLHVRQLTHFLFEAAQRATDVVATDYFPEEKSWGEARGERPAALSPAKLGAINQEVAHLTDRRAKFTSGGSQWSAFDLYRSLADVMQRFAEAVPSERVAADFKSRVAAAMPTARGSRTELSPLSGLAVGVLATQAAPPQGGGGR